jgi:ankyrin repeat protein
MFDSSHGRTCLHYAAYYGHAESLRAILSAAKSAPVSQSWLAFVRALVSTAQSVIFWLLLADVALEVQGVRPLRQREGRHRGDAAALRGEAGVAALRSRLARERRHRVRVEWCMRVRIPLSLSLPVGENAFLCDKKFASFEESCGMYLTRARACFRFPGSTPLHLAARGGNLDCVRQLLSWGADRLQRDSVG